MRGGPARRVPITTLDQIDSTNLHARRLILSGTLSAAASAGECPLVLAKTQTAGIGRFGRAWSSPRGGLWATWVVPPAAFAAARTSLDQVGLVAGIACLNTIRSALAHSGFADDANSRIQLKWPNDIVIDGKKVCGVLCETVIASATPSDRWLFIGIGINADFNLEDFPENLRATSTTLRQCCQRDEPAIQPERLAHALSEQLWVHVIERGFDEPALREARTSLFGMGEQVIAFLPDGREVRGRLDGLTDSGFAELSTVDGPVTLSAVTGLRVVADPQSSLRP